MNPPAPPVSPVSPVPDRLLTAKDVARHLDMNYKYVLRLINDGVIPRIQRAKGCSIRVRESTLNRLYPERLARRND
jgi:predicted DNA-binding transcriptional regulator AlpA